MTLDNLFFAGVNVLLAWSVYVALITGSLSFAQGAFMALGCYGAGVLTVKFGLPLYLASVLAAAATAALAALLGYPALRLRGIYLILVTIGITYCVRVILENVDYVGGVAGFGGMQGASLEAVIAVVCVVGALLTWLSHSPLQRICDAVREDDRVAASLGIDVTRVRLAGFAAGAAIAAIAGALYGHYMNFVRPESFDVMVSIYVVLYVVLGGVNNLWGPLLGATVMTLLPEYFRVLAEWRPTFFGLAILVLLLFRPDGLLSFRTPTSRRPRLAKTALSDTVLSIRALSKHFGGVKALDGIDLHVDRGEILGLIGPNGAGKTALVNTITGFYRATGGSILLDGQEISRLPMHVIGRLGIGRTFQNIRLFRRMSVLENVLVALKTYNSRPLRSFLRSGSAKADVATAMRLLDDLQLADRADTRADALSYGDARRLEIARALAGRPTLLLLDEPAAGMNESETLRLIADIRLIRAKVPAILLIEHAMPLIRALSDRLVAMDYGKKIAEGMPETVLAHPEVLRAYLGSEAETEAR